MNHFELEEENNLGLEKLKPDMRMQIDLALRLYGISKEGLSKEDLDSYVMKWVQYNKNKFSGDFRLVLSKHPELLVEYEKDPLSALGKMEDLLYTQADIHK